MDYKEFLLDNKDLIIKEDWLQLYDRAIEASRREGRYQAVALSDLTSFLSAAGINMVAEFQKVGAVPEHAFYTHKLPTALNLSDLKRVEMFAFASTEGLKHLNLKSITQLDMSAFGYSKLEDVQVEDVLRWEPGVFQNCGSLKKADLRNAGCTDMGERTFLDCSNLTEVILPSTIATLCSHTFGDCPKLKSITLPKSLMLLEPHVFAARSLDEITMEGRTFDEACSIEGSERLYQILNPEGKLVCTDKTLTGREFRDYAYEYLI